MSENRFTGGNMVPMTADGSVLWEKITLPKLGLYGATMLVSPDCPEGTIETLQDAAENCLPNEVPAGEGSFGTITKVDVNGVMLAIKRAKERNPYNEAHTGLNWIRANLALSVGLKRLSLTNPGVTKVVEVGSADEPTIEYDFGAPSYFAVLSPNRPYAEQSLMATSIMSYAPGSHPGDSSGMPRPETYTSLFDAACASTGMTPKSVEYDLHDRFGRERRGNVLLNPIGVEDGVVKVTATVLDVYVNYTLDF